MPTQAAQIFKTIKPGRKPTPSSLTDDKGKGKMPLQGVKTGSKEPAGLKLKKTA
jgi:hypothetical protein